MKDSKIVKILFAVVSIIAPASTALAEREPVEHVHAEHDHESAAHEPTREPAAHEPTHEPAAREAPRDTPADKALEKITSEWHDVHTEAQRRDDELRDFHFGHSENTGPVRGEGAPSGNSADHHEPHEHEHFDR